MIKRTVKPENEIPVTMLTDDAIAQRVAAGTFMEMKPETVEEFKNLHHFLNHLEGDIESRTLLDEIYRVVDVFIANEVAPISVCARGCSQCCYVPVSITAIEMVHIAEREGIKELVNTRASMDFLSTSNKRQACTFLGDEGMCSIYDSRPIACRVFSTIDHYKHCYEEREHEIITFRSSEFIYWVLSFLENASANALPKFTLQTDIRKWFPKGKGKSNG